LSREVASNGEKAEAPISSQHVLPLDSRQLCPKRREASLLVQNGVLPTRRSNLGPKRFARLPIAVDTNSRAKPFSLIQKLVLSYAKIEFGRR
jgi:hypothetical protein